VQSLAIAGFSVSRSHRVMDGFDLCSLPPYSMYCCFTHMLPLYHEFQLLSLNRDSRTTGVLGKTGNDCFVHFKVSRQ